MIWLTWRQFRAQAVTAGAALVAVAIALAVSGPYIRHLYDINLVGTCQAHGDCQRVVAAFLQQLSTSYVKVIYFIVLAALLLAPAIIGIFWGAPLIAREVEAGTFRLAWNQSVTRARWTAVKLAGVGLASVAVAGLLSLMLTWWSGPFVHAAGLIPNPSGAPFGEGRFQIATFAASGVAPIGYAAFAFALGVAVGLLVRRTLPAMAITLAIFFAVWIVMPLAIRPHLMSPVHVTRAFNASNLTELTTGSDGRLTVVASINIPGAWILSNQTLTPAGQVFTGPAPQPCLSQTGTMQACTNALGPLHLRQFVTYQPASRYWDFQGIETGIFVALALLLAGSTFWLVRRRLS